MPDPISIATLSILGGLAIYKIGKIILKIKKATLQSTCCSCIEIHNNDDTNTLKTPEGSIDIEDTQGESPRRHRSSHHVHK